ncbi:MAG: hypothetical protein UX09_C0029G0020 [Candidatus Uhrbacteria bacterium GW2011_GWE2_45_35]|uniref:Uncharacterized protein n=1 Tax=Candidatus Uhrbacteria bacterium GW2011_GWE2_45_35 TaxID=1618993 RepID=A0A0G1MGL9_9BACT|nr:MAG: hypothetical protein UX09_C0029G0020 [Candidatus Uhrbacteria bacterium GW2011_GWE2_45_35]
MVYYFSVSLELLAFSAHNMRRPHHAVESVSASLGRQQINNSIRQQWWLGDSMAVDRLSG